MTTPDMTCQELVELVTEYLEGTLPESDKPRFQAHLKACDGCETYLEQMRFAIRALGRLTDKSIPLDAQQKLLIAFIAVGARMGIPEFPRLFGRPGS